MKNKLFTFLLGILLLFINNCTGYKPIFKSNLNFEISDYSIEGEKIAGNKIYSKLHNLSKSSKKNLNKRNLSITIKTTKDKKATIKESSGKISEYKITLKMHVKITDFITGDKILNQTFISSTNYKSQSQYSDTISLENKSTDTLINNIYQKLLIKLSENIII